MAKTKKKTSKTPKIDVAKELQSSFVRHLHLTLGKDKHSALDKDFLKSACLTVRDHMVDDWLKTLENYYSRDVKRVYYLSMEFLIGRTLGNTLINMKMYDAFAKALRKEGLELTDLEEEEWDAGLGNGGLGRLAACYLDSMSTTGIPAMGYGIRYEYGIFFQHIQNGYQIETPDNWLRYGNPWEFPRPERLYEIKFYGETYARQTDHGTLRHEWRNTQSVMAMAYDTPIPGYNNGIVNTMRLWAAKSTREFDLEDFHDGDYVEAVAGKNESENISKVLYPNDNNMQGKELRLKQEYFFVSATLQDVIRRHLKTHDGFENFPDKVAIQLNDTHPAIGVVELMRLLMDEYHLDWDSAWDITTRTFSYTNHTVLPEALETWTVELLGKLLPRHLQLIYEINHRFLQGVWPALEDKSLLSSLSMIQEYPEKSIRMANLALIGSHTINGVSEMHSHIVKDRIFPAFYQLFPDKFQNKTNGVTQRRWIALCNPRLAGTLTRRIGEDWLTDLSLLKELLVYEKDTRFYTRLKDIKTHNKERLAKTILDTCGLQVDPNSLFDCQTKRIHEYKRQLMFVLYMVTQYNRVKYKGHTPKVPRTFILSGKAAPGYFAAKKIIKLFNAVADKINQDPHVSQYYKGVFLPNYSVSLAEKIIPAADLSEQISTAGKEASGTGNMKYALNGALTIGTLDGANVEMSEEMGQENMFIFGMTETDIENLTDYDPRQVVDSDPELKMCLDLISEGYFTPEKPDLFHDLIHTLYSQDPYYVLGDYRAYIDTQAKVDNTYLDPKTWGKMVVHNIANMGKFSSDRSVLEYAQDIWNITPVPGQPDGYRWEDFGK